MAKKNLQGGKRFKSSKQGGTGEPEYHEIDKGQMVGKVIRNLGTRQMLVYCNDDKTRICHIRGGLRKRTWIMVGDIVLMSVRELGVGMSGGVGSLVSGGSAAAEKGDILTKYDQDVFGRLKKEPGINPRLFLSVDQITGNANYKEEEDAFVFTDESSSDEEDSEGGEDGGKGSGGIVDKRNKVNHRANGRSAPVETPSGDIDIDAI
jgi:translation initiation factor 1A